MKLLVSISTISLLFHLLLPAAVQAQTPPSDYEISNFNSFHAAIYRGEIKKIEKHILDGADVEQTDNFGRTALHIAAYQSNEEVFKQLINAGSNVNAFENDRYDVVTIAAVANDLPMLLLALENGGDPKNMTSPYDGTALIAAAHLGHVEIVKALLKAGSNIDHINNLAWTALIEAVVLGDGGPKHTAIVKDLLAYGANRNIGDRDGVTPLTHAKTRGYKEIVHVLETK
ncbi:hypothetical protein A9Q83_15920 [Alphaproteobacteria bacterium 46_93_T64]|nr:hypothetical protein A9Q83_15920 [Alphaproteobacteria bacterium 46_93_T64]